MKTPSKTRNERVDFRISQDFKALFARAAELSGVNMSAFIIEAARERAVRLIEQHERLVLNNEARDVLLAALASPPAPADNLRRAVEKHS
jgi:uncharacterized protein (DUF1778 family)